MVKCYICKKEIKRRRRKVFYDNKFYEKIYFCTIHCKEQFIYKVAKGKIKPKRRKKQTSIISYG
ncbi:MAG: hypothetical protein ACTSQJ_00240 [Promethearchaeota archaeon]